MDFGDGHCESPAVSSRSTYRAANSHVEKEAGGSLKAARTCRRDPTTAGAATAAPWRATGRDRVQSRWYAGRSAQARHWRQTRPATPKWRRGKARALRSDEVEIRGAD
eukprot:4151822-Pleurochrysis_carterae.AAC.2